jgi:hypothetical protein
MIFLPLGFCPFYHSKHQVPKWLMYPSNVKHVS